MGDTNQVNFLTHHTSEAEFYADYHRDALKGEPRTDYINGWQIDYVAFADEATKHNPPIFIIGGAFQNFNSYKYFINSLLEAAPVILIDMPSMGSNAQTHNSHLNIPAIDIDMVEITRLYAQWVDSVGIDKVSIMGMSLGSVVAANYADMNPERMHRLVLMGVLERTRKSWRMLIEESLKILDEQRMQEFGEAVVLYLVNHAKLEKTRMSGMARRMFHDQMSTFSYNEQLRYRINAHRLLNVGEIPKSKCPTLVATGQYDSFTLPHENAGYAAGCDDAVYAQVLNADHVPQLQRRKQTTALFTTFLKAEDIHQLDGIRVLSDDDMANLDRRSEPRISINQSFTLSNRTKPAWSDTVTVVDMNFFGLMIEAASIEAASHIFAESRDTAITLHDEHGDFRIELLQFQQKGRKIRALFKHGSFANAERLLNHIKTLTVDLPEKKDTDIAAS